MDKYWLERTELLVRRRIGKAEQSNVLVVGLGGVGSFAAEFLARAGVRKYDDCRWRYRRYYEYQQTASALHSTVGKHKVEVVAERLLDINPQLNLIKINEFLNPERMDEVLDSGNLIMFWTVSTV
jgi:tRNA A37 threonylcarbamoyladenosine dehydratase